MTKSTNNTTSKSSPKASPKKIVTAAKKTKIKKFTDIDNTDTSYKLSIKLLTISMVIITIILLVTGYFLYQKFNNMPESTILVDNNLKNQEFITLQQELNDRFNKLEQKLNNTNENITITSSKLNNFIQNSNQSLLNKAKLTIDDALQLLDVRQDFKKSAQLLQKASIILQQNSGTTYQSEQNILNKAASDLLSMQPLDNKIVMDSLQNINSEVDNLLFAKVNMRKTKKTIKNKNNLLANIWSDIKGLIVVNVDNGESVGKLLSTKSKLMAYNLVKLQIKQIQISVIFANQLEFNNNVSILISLTKQIFDQNHTNTAVFLEKLKNLNDKHIQMGNLPQSIEQVRAIINS